MFFAAIGLAGGAGLGRIEGDACFIAAALCWAVYTIMGKRLLQRIDPLLSVALTTAFGSVVLFLFAARQLGSIDWLHLGAGFWLNQLYLGLFPSAIANWFYYTGVKHIGPARTSVFMNLVPIFGLLLSFIILHESVTWLQAVGSALMICGVWLVNRRARTTVGEVAANVASATQPD